METCGNVQLKRWLECRGIKTADNRSELLLENYAHFLWLCQQTLPDQKIIDPFNISTGKHFYRNVIGRRVKRRCLLFIAIYCNNKIHRDYFLITNNRFHVGFFRLKWILLYIFLLLQCTSTLYDVPSILMIIHRREQTR